MTEKKTEAKAAPEAQVDAGAATEEGGAKTGRGKLLVIVAAATLLVGGGGAAAYSMLAPKEGAKAEAKPAPRKVPVFIDLDTFTVNLPDDDDDERFMQVKLVAEVRDNAGGEMLKTMMPAVRNQILLLLGSKRAADLATREGKEKLANEIVVAANKPLDGTPAAGAVESVNFTHLIVQ